MIGDTSGTEVIRIKVEEALSELLGVTAQVDKHDQRIKCIHKEIQKMYDSEDRRSTVSDEELKDFVRKYFVFQLDGEETEEEQREKARLAASRKPASARLPPDTIEVPAVALASLNKADKHRKIELVRKTPGKKK
jgi:citrate (Re)-synthase